MISLLFKEIRGFFSSLTGYVVMIVFLIANSLFMWVFPGEMNVFDSAYASVDTLFIMAPWIFLFLVPAITMRMVAEEKKSGTIELLFTRPLSDLNIILAKYFAGVILVLLSLLPTLIFFMSVYLLGSPVGNIDLGGTIGSFIGLFFLASVYVAIGILCSSISENQIVAFVLAIIISFFMYIGFESIAGMPLFKSINNLISNMGVNEHYKSMSRGVIDSRDLVYFFGLNAILIAITKVIFQSRKW